MSETFHLTAVIWPEKGRYVSHRPELGVASYGKTPASARRALREAIRLWLDNARELGMLDEVRPVLRSEERYATSLEVAV